MSEKLNTDLRTAAYALAITRLNDYYMGSGLIAWKKLIYAYFMTNNLDYCILTLLNLGHEK